MSIGSLANSRSVTKKDGKSNTTLWSDEVDAMNKESTKIEDDNKGEKVDKIFISNQEVYPMLEKNQMVEDGTGNKKET